jgi:hypothetical protein
MLSPHMLEQYRRMTPRERIAEMRALMDVAARALKVLPPDERARRLAAEDRLRRSSIDALLDGLTALSAEHAPHYGG